MSVAKTQNWVNDFLNLKMKVYEKELNAASESIDTDLETVLNDVYELCFRSIGDMEKVLEGKPHLSINRPRLRSILWVELLGEVFRKHYSGNEHRVFTKYHKGNSDIEGISELMFDINVCGVKEIDGFTCVTKSVWQIESEFKIVNEDHKKTKSLILDFSKLLIGKSKNKMLITSESNRNIEDVFMDLKKVDGSGPVTIAYMTHPGKWASDSLVSIKEI